MSCENISPGNKKFLFPRLIAAVIKSSLAEEMDLIKSQLLQFSYVFESPEEYPDDYELILQEDLKISDLSEEERRTIVSFLRKIAEELP